ncbi:MAG: ChaN family lipoprotein [Candidatus Aminicenantaceae bacterium]
MSVKWKIVFSLIFILNITLLFSQKKEDQSLLLQLGNKQHKDKTIEVFSEKIYSAREGKSIPFLKMIREMRNDSFIYVGENHDSLPMHDIQLQIIQALLKQDRNLSIGLEMLPVTCQEVLNKWNLGILATEEFIKEASWYENWDFNFGFYNKIFEFAKINRIPLYALNVPRQIIRKIRIKGWEALSGEEKNLVPKPDLSHEEHRKLIRAIFESTELPPQMKGKGLESAFEGLYRAQSAWDEVMAFYALQAADKEERKMVVLAGSGHLLYNLGINRRAHEKNNLPYKTVICVTVPEDKKRIRISRSLADYIWGIGEEARPAFPSVGLKFKKFEGLENLVIEIKPIAGVARNADFKKGDVLLSADGKRFSDINELKIHLSKFSWGDRVRFRLLREAREIEIELQFQTTENKN